MWKFSSTRSSRINDATNCAHYLRDICCGNDEWQCRLIKLHFNSLSYACNYIKDISILICILYLHAAYTSDKNKFSHDCHPVGGDSLELRIQYATIIGKNSRKSINMPVTHDCVLWHTMEEMQTSKIFEIFTIRGCVQFWREGQLWFYSTLLNGKNIEIIRSYGWSRFIAVLIYIAPAKWISCFSNRQTRAKRDFSV